VRDKNNTHPVIEVGERGYQVCLRVLIERCRWLVKHQKSGLAQQSARYAYALAFAA
jgi:hypothetical protein